VNIVGWTLCHPKSPIIVPDDATQHVRHRWVFQGRFFEIWAYCRVGTELNNGSEFARLVSSYLGYKEALVI